MEYYIREAFASEPNTISRIITEETGGGSKLVQCWSAGPNLIQILFSRKIK
jgi:hypothetical protein